MQLSHGSLSPAAGTAKRLSHVCHLCKISWWKDKHALSHDGHSLHLQLLCICDSYNYAVNLQFRTLIYIGDRFGVARLGKLRTMPSLPKQEFAESGNDILLTSSDGPEMA